jgi:hypothetical protein
MLIIRTNHATFVDRWGVEVDVLDVLEAKNVEMDEDGFQYDDNGNQYDHDDLVRGDGEWTTVRSGVDYVYRGDPKTKSDIYRIFRHLDRSHPLSIGTRNGKTYLNCMCGWKFTVESTMFSDVEAKVREHAKSTPKDAVAKP